MHSTRPSASAGVRLLIRYRRGLPPDEELLRVMEGCLVDLGLHPVVERRRWLGLEWARAVEDAESEAPRGEAGAGGAEGVAFEIESIPESMAVPAGPGSAVEATSGHAGEEGAEGILWRGPEDDGAVAAFLQSHLGGVASPGAAIRIDLENGLHLRGRAGPGEGRSRPLEAIGGAIPLTSEFYLVRPADAEVRRALNRRDGLVHIQGGRQMGKTSLLARGLQYARDRGDRVVLTDLQKLNAAALEDPDRLFLTLAEAFADQLDLASLPQDAWDRQQRPDTNFERYLRHEVLPHVRGPLVWGMDEVDRLFATPHGGELFALFRAWQGEPPPGSGGTATRLTLLIAYATEAHLFIRDPSQSPFPMGTPVALGDFTLEQVAELNERSGRPLRTAAEVDRFYALVHGHPFLTRRALNDLATRGKGLAELLQEADAEQGLFGDHLQRMLMSLQRAPELQDAVRRVLERKPCPTPEAFFQLRAAGVIRGQDAGTALPRCGLYERYLSRHLLGSA